MTDEDRVNRGSAQLRVRSVGWGATLLFLGVAMLMSTCAVGLVTSPLTPLAADAELLGQKKTSTADLLTLLAFVLPMCVVFWRAAWVANGSRKHIERRFLSPLMGWFVAVVFGGPSVCAVAFGLFRPEVSTAQTVMAAFGAALFCSAPLLAKRLTRRTLGASSNGGRERSGEKSPAADRYGAA